MHHSQKRKKKTKRKAVFRACENCKKIVWAELICPKCGGKTTTDFKGFLGITDPEKSKIAKKLGIKKKGKYALQVKGR